MKISSRALFQWSAGYANQFIFTWPKEIHLLVYEHKVCMLPTAHGLGKKKYLQSVVYFLWIANVSRHNSNRISEHKVKGTKEHQLLELLQDKVPAVVGEG